jgi:hypothetical protein
MATQRAPFHCGFFWYAMEGFIGRPCDFRYLMGFDGYYTFSWDVDESNTEEYAKIRQAVSVFPQWLDMFDMVFSQCRVAIEDREPTIIHQPDGTQKMIGAAKKVLKVNLHCSVERKPSELHTVSR